MAVAIPSQHKKATKELEDAGPVAHVAEVVHYGEKIVLPEALDIDDAIGILYRRRDYLNERTVLVEDFDVFPWDGANATREVLTAMYGWAPSGYGSPSIKVDVDFGKAIYVPWGEFTLPNTEATLNCGVGEKSNRMCFRLTCNVRHRDEATVKDIFAKIREFLVKGSIYRGKAIKLRFLDDRGRPLQMPEPAFMDVSKLGRHSIIYSKHIHDAIETNLFTPIERVEDCLANELPVKRAVLLGGTYGTGKTLAAAVASKIAVDNGITFVYVPRADELKLAIEFAKQYQSPACAVFCEDIDRVTKGERSVSMDDLLNIIDGIDSKSANIIMVLTTNDIDSINPAMIRPGRLDSVIEVTPPDAEAVVRLIKHYAGESLAADADLTTAGEALAGCIPAIVAEVLKRAKLSELKRLPKGSIVKGLSDVAIVEAALTMKGQNDLLARLIKSQEDTGPSFEDKFKDAVVDAIHDHLTTQ